MLDFTLAKYKELIFAIKNKRYEIYTFKNIINLNDLHKPHVILRHDVDRMPGRALKLAKLEHELNIVSTYFFRTKSVSFSRDVIKQILKLGHEIGYHYEELSDAKGDYELAWQLFQKNIKQFDEFGGVKTIAAHGKPFYKWDNRDLWKTRDYKKLGIKIEAYQDIGWDNYLYFTDVGRCWNSKNNVRDRIIGSVTANLNNAPRNTTDLIEYIKQSKKNLIISTHPERWSENTASWLQVLVMDHTVNLTKKIILFIKYNYPPIL